MQVYENDMLHKLSDMVVEEMDGVARYARCAIQHKAENPKLAEMFHEMSLQEMSHMDKLIDQVREDLKAMQTAYSQA